MEQRIHQNQIKIKERKSNQKRVVLILLFSSSLFCRFMVQFEKIGRRIEKWGN